MFWMDVEAAGGAVGHGFRVSSLASLAINQVIRLVDKFNLVRVTVVVVVVVVVPVLVVVIECLDELLN